MKHNTLSRISITIILLLVLPGAIVAGRALAQESSPQGSQSAQASVGSAFTYQGRLENASGPVNGKCDIKFELYDDANAGSLQGTETKTNVDVSDGYFSVQLDFGTAAFIGDARWLAISVACPTGGAFAPLSGRITLSAAPYALSLKPGAAVVDPSGTVSGLYGQSGPDWMLPLLIATKKAGLWGGSRWENGVIGTSDTGNGVYGFSSSGKAVYADGDAYVDGELYVNNKLYSDGDFHALSNAEVDGNLNVHSDLSWDARTGYVSVAAAAFNPSDGGYDFLNNGKALWNMDGNSDFYPAPVQLPHGATVTKLTFYWWDGSSSDGSCGLWRIDFTGGEASMADASTSGSAATPSSSEDTSVNFAVVDNSQYAYYLWLSLPDMVVAAYGAVIEYTFTEPY